MTLDSQNSEKKETVFTHCVNSELKIDTFSLQPKNFLNVLHIGYDETYGDVFKAWGDHENMFTICFGTKGDEF